MAVAARGLETWQCAKPECRTINVAERSHCSECQAARLGRVPAVEAVPPMDLEEFCRRQSSRGVRRLTAELDVVGSEIYLTLAAPTNDPPQVFLITNENGVAPCDNCGRVSW